MELRDIDDFELNNEEIKERPAKVKKTKASSKSKTFFVFGLVFMLIAITSLAAIFLYVGKDILLKHEQPEVVVEPEVTYTQSEVDKMVKDATDETREKTEALVTESYEKKIYEAAMEDSGILRMLRASHPDQVVYIYGSKYEFYPVLDELRKNTISNDDLIKDEETSRITYQVEDEVKSHICIDVSSFQKEVNWDKVKADGVEYVMIRCAFRGYESGKIVDDSMFESHIKGATKAGLKVGVYFFTEALTPEEAVEEAEYALDLIAPYKISLPVAIDVEEVSGKARTDVLTVDEVSENCAAFMNRIVEAGYDTMIYSNAKFFIKKLNVKTIEGYDKWLALYNDEVYFPYDFVMWQYASDAKVDGIKGNVDINISFKEW